MAAEFTGFTPGLFQFLAELEANNERDWFKANQARYEAEVREPARAFVRAMAPRLETFSPHFVASDKKVGGSLMRIHRDVRFSKDKSPYKTNVGIHFRHEVGKDVHCPGLYVHLDTDNIFLGVGMWHPDKDGLAAIRGAIDEDPDGWLAVRDDPAFRAVWNLTGDSLKRPPKGYDKTHPMLEDLKRKDHIAGCDLTLDDIVGPGSVDAVFDRLAVARPYAEWLTRVIGQPF